MHVDLLGPFVTLTAPTGIGGTATFNLPIPRDMHLAGLQAFAQALVLDPGGAWSNLLSLTGGLRILVGAN